VGEQKATEVGRSTKNVLVIKFFTFTSLHPFESRAPFQHQNLKMADSADVTASLQNLTVTFR
jgi:hypothetical protein